MPEILYFPYFGPSRRSDRTVVEIRLDFTPGDEQGFPRNAFDIGNLLVEADVLAADEEFPEQALPDDRMGWYSSLLVQTALLLQRKTGHRVHWFSLDCDVDKARCIALMEHEHCDVGMTAVKLAEELMAGKRRHLAEPFRQFSDFAGDRVLPRETEAILSAARRRDIPCFKLDRPPFSGKLKRGFRVRRNGLLQLGHGAAGHVVDGSYSQGDGDDYLLALLKNPEQRIAVLEKFGVPVARSPVALVKPSGELRLLAVNERVFAVMASPDGRMREVDGVHASLLDLALAIHGEARRAPVAITLLTPDFTQPLAAAGGAVVDFELAPDLAAFADQGRNPALLDKTANALLDSLFSGDRPARMPIIAVTGTNGKTTTCRMIAHILQQAGRRPGLVVTDGIYLGGIQLSAEDAGSFIGHSRVLSSKAVDVAVLEAHHRGIAVRGFAFDRCDVAVCLNVTHDHIKSAEIGTLEEMAVLKRALPERARRAAVLFADDDACRNMAEHLTADKICLVSLESDAEELGRLYSGRRMACCVLEHLAEGEWLVIHDGEQRTPLLPVADIPATFSGTARFNVSNAMHAAMAVFQSGLPAEQISAALRIFSAGPEMTPGRMNEINGFPFRLILDFAHNPDGMRKICDFVGRQQVAGRRILAFSGSSKRSDETARKTARTVAGHFDFYFCKDYEPSVPPKRRYIAPAMKDTLVEAGVPEHQTAVMTFGRDVVHRILDFCEPGDLLVFLVGTREKTTVPGYLDEYLRR